MIPQRNLALLSNRLARGGGRRIPEAVLERDYCLAWFLVGLSRTKLRERPALAVRLACRISRIPVFWREALMPALPNHIRNQLICACFHI